MKNKELIYEGKTHIYLETNSENDSATIIKYCKQKFPNDIDIRFLLNEYNLGKSIDIEGVRKVYRFENRESSPSLHLEYIDGTTLKNFQHQHQLSLQEKLSIAIECTHILGQLHQLNIIHKDINNSNILIENETRHIKFIDFGLASKSESWINTNKSPDKLQGTLPFISPEQTGRMNRAVDYRTDLYSLGVTFYELFTNQLPFEAQDSLGWVHAHIAKKPAKLTEIVPDLPSILSNIILKLMAKHAEERYQSTQGLLFDLKKIQNGEHDFALGQNDYSGKLQIPKKLYGRKKEIETLLTALERVSQGSLEMMLIAGYSGVGKTALVHEIQKPIIQKQGYFISGKFDQYQRNIPYSAIVQAFKQFFELLLIEDETRLIQWRKLIQDCLGNEGRVLVDMIPELEIIIGKQPEIPDLGGKEAQNRFNYVFQNFIKAIAQQDHPLILFIDDLQWADSGSIDLLKVLLTDKDSHYFLCLCAYRDNEVNVSHPFIKAIDSLKEEQATIHQLHIDNLSQDNINELLVDTLANTSEHTHALTELIFEKTRGNAFFSHQFLQNLYDNHLLTFDFDTAQWHWNTSKIRRLNLSDNVIEFMAERIKTLSLTFQELIMIAACIGNRFDLKTLTFVVDKDEDEVQSVLDLMMGEGLLTHNYEYYSFVHDRVQQAAYSLIPEKTKANLHLQIGRKLLEHIPQEKQEDHLFDIVNQMNWGLEIIENPEERELLAKLNLFAGRKAKANAAYIPAYTYINTGIQFLSDDFWNNQYHLSLLLYNEAAETAYMSAQFEEMDQAIDVIFSHVTQLLDKVTAYRIRILSFKARNQLIDSIETGLELLAALGVNFPQNPTQDDTALALGQTMELLKEHSLDEIYHFPEMVDPAMKAALTIIADVNSSVYWARAELFPFMVFKAVELSVKYGNTPISAFGYSTYGVILSGVVGDMPQAFEFGEMALKLIDKFQAKEWITQLYTPHYALIVHWNQHIKHTLKPLEESFHIGLETGAIEYAAINVNLYCIHGYLMGMKLKLLQADIEAYSKMMKTYKQETNYNFNQIYHQAVLNLMGKVDNPCLLIGSAYNEEDMLPMHLAANDNTASFFVYFNKMILNYLFENYQEAEDNRNQAESRLSAILAKLENTTYRLYDSLIALALYPTSTPDKQEQFLKRVENNQDMMKNWAKFAPMNFEHKFFLVEAEKLRVTNQSDDILAIYNKAIEGALKNDFLNEAALAYELTGKFFLNQNKYELAENYLKHAFQIYSQWGAKAKVKELIKQYPKINESSKSLIVSSTTTQEGSINLDFGSVIKASETMSSQIVLNDLIEKMMSIVMENAGAERGILILRSEEDMQIVAEGTNEGITFIKHLLNDEQSRIPMTVYNLVSRTLKPLVIDNASKDNRFMNDPYIIKNLTHSILCQPIIHQGICNGLIYLENSLPSAFSFQRTEVLRLLSGQIAISIANAKLYETLEDKVIDRTKELSQTVESLKQTQSQLVQAEKMASLGQLTAGIAHEINNPINFISNSLKSLKMNIQDIQKVLKLYEQLTPDNVAQNLSQLNHLKAELDYPILLEELESLPAQIEEGVQRTTTIVKGLHTFSRRDENMAQSIDIHENLDSTLMLLKPQIPKNFNIIREYSEELPLVQCFSSKLNQVFMNIIINAIQAIKEKSQQEDEWISIQTSLHQEQVSIKIADSGPGISKDIQERLFEPFFTTKEIGKGTGLGLSISYGIIQEHKGSLSVESQKGKGTIFTIVLPLNYES